MAVGQRIFRFILVFVVLLAIWLLLSGKYDVFHTSWGVAGSLVLAGLSVRRSPKTLFPLGRFLLFVPWQLWQIFISNLRIAKIAMTPGLPIRPRLLRKPPKVRDPRALTLLGCSITLTPGTLTININEDHMLIHALDDASASDIDAEVMADKVAGVFGEDVG